MRLGRGPYPHFRAECLGRKRRTERYGCSGFVTRCSFSLPRKSQSHFLFIDALHLARGRQIFELNKVKRPVVPVSANDYKF